MKMTDEDLDALVSCSKHHGFQFVVELIDERIEKLKLGFLSVPLDKDPEKAALILLQERYKIEGAINLKVSVLQAIKDLKEKIR
jgi:hypothetical protein